MEGLQLLVIATVPEDFRKTTLNMKAPIVINTANNLATQVVLPFNYEFKYPLYAEDWEYECELEECEGCGACDEFERLESEEPGESGGSAEAGDN